VQFRVDIGSRALSTTRLERLIRDADAFIGLYSIPGSVTDMSDVEQLRQSSRYFRLEMDMSIRSRRPAIVVVDNRYHAYFTLLPGVRQSHYAAQEVHSNIVKRSGSPARDGLKHTFKAFCLEVERASSLRTVTPPASTSCVVGLLVPPFADDRLREEYV